MSKAQRPGFNQLLHCAGQAQQTKEVGDCGAILAGANGHLLLGHMKFAG